VLCKRLAVASQALGSDGRTRREADVGDGAVAELDQVLGGVSRALALLRRQRVRKRRGKVDGDNRHAQSANLLQQRAVFDADHAIDRALFDQARQGRALRADAQINAALQGLLLHATQHRHVERHLAQGRPAHLVGQ
jgi:hypothetical protein